ncbi:MAG: hypothetical protein AAFR53_06455 [Pseudomonadota bacterium]
MSDRSKAIGLLLVGSGTRILGAALIVALLWGGFFWATATPGAL